LPIESSTSIATCENYKRAHVPDRVTLSPAQPPTNDKQGTRIPAIRSLNSIRKEVKY
jgi:hypothetical protein